MDGKSIRIKHLEEKSPQADIKNIFAHMLEKVLPEPAVRHYVKFNRRSNILSVDKRKYDLNAFNQIIVIGGGKAAKRTGAELVKIIGEKISAGVLNVYQDQADEPISSKIKLFAADHPTPNER